MPMRLQFASAFFVLVSLAAPIAISAQEHVLVLRPTPQAVASPPSTLPSLRSNGTARATRAMQRPRLSRGKLDLTTSGLTEAFSGPATATNAWVYGDSACITAGSSTLTPMTSIPACGPNAPQDLDGQGALELTPPVNHTDGFAFNTTPISTSNGISATFNYYSFNSNWKAGDGLALVLADASQPIPRSIGGCCGSLGYARYINHPALTNGYLAVGMDETGYFSAADEGKTGGLAGKLPNLITVRGATQTKAQFLLTTTNAAGQPAALPFMLNTPKLQIRPTGLTINVTLTAAGLLSVSVDRHDGNGSLMYIAPTQIVGLHGQPALPAQVYLGFTSAGGGANARHQINNFVVASAPTTETSVLTYHNDTNRTGWNPNETVLTTSNVSPSTFGLLHTVALDGRVDAQPLVVPYQAIATQGIHDVVYVATENNTVYAIDAHSGAILRTRNFGASIPNGAKDYDDNVYPFYGILSTPVIDLTRNAMYVVTDTNEGVGATDVYRLHMLALGSFADIVPSTVIVPATTLSNGSSYVFPAQHERQRPALLEANGTIYVAFGSTGDTQPALSRGVIAGFSATNLTPLASNVFANRLYEASNPFYLTAIWQSGYGPAADTQGNVYFSTGNSDPNNPSYDGSTNFPDSVLKVAPDLSHVLDSFTQYDYFTRDREDGDFGSGGTMVVPDQSGGVYPHLVVAGGKDGKQYILNRDGLGGYTPQGPNRDLAQLANGGCWCGPAYFVGADSIPRIVTGGGNGVATWQLLDGASFNLMLEGRISGSYTNGQPDGGGTIPTVSSNGTAPGSAIVWFVQRPNESQTYTLNLRAFDAANLQHQLYASPAGNWTNYNSNANAVPTVANGYVYVGSLKQLQIFGLLGK